MATAIEPSLVHSPAPESSNRSFGFVFACVFSIIGMWPLLRLESPRWWALAVAVLFALLAIIRPGFLRPLNKAWLALGRLMHRVISPLVMGAIFFLCVTPIGWIMRRRGKDILSLARHPDLPSYWIARDRSPLEAADMKRQF